MNKSLIIGLFVFITASALFIYSSEQRDIPDLEKSGTDQTSSSTSSVGQITDERIINLENDEPGNWLSHGRTYEETRYSPLTQINKESVGQLGLAWYKDMGTNRAQESTPIIVDDIMYLTSSWSIVYAIDAKTGETLWRYDPKVPREHARKACCDVVNRGVAVYEGLVYVGSLDGRLISLNAETGDVVWEVDTIIDRDRFYTVTGAPRVAKGKVFIGNGGAEFGVRGYVTAYNAKTGEEEWRFFTVPGDPSVGFQDPAMKMAAATWKGGNYWEFGGGGTVWNSIVYDPEFENVYLGVGNGSPWTRAVRSPGGGDNLFLSSIVALDVDTGKMKWYYQTTPGDNWDFTAVQDMALADMEIDGVMKKVLLQAPKNGFFYVIDRSDGDLTPGERLLRAHPFASVTWATHVDLNTGRPVENPDLDYIGKEKWILPGPLGAHNWQAMSVDIDAGVVYIPAQDNPLIYGMNEEWKKTGVLKRDARGWNTGLEFGRLIQLMDDNSADQPTPKGYLKAFNPLTGEDKWVVEIPHYWNGGVVSTAGGLVFQGDALGMLKAYDKDSGDMLWEYNTYTSMLAPPITYEIDGIQYVAILTGSGGGDIFSGESAPPNATYASLKYNNYGKLLVFKLGGNAELPIPQVRDRTIPVQKNLVANVDAIASGERSYNQYCAPCHGLVVRSAGSIPDLRMMSVGVQENFNEIVLKGILAGNGMASFGDVLTEVQSDHIHQFIKARAEEDRLQIAGEIETSRLTWQDGAR